jgi:flagellar hook protein FlgE
MRRISADIASADIQRPQDTSAAVDLTRSLVELKQASLQTQASVKVVRSADLMIGSLLDIKA